jgi:hypothetical protein
MINIQDIINELSDLVEDLKYNLNEDDLVLKASNEDGFDIKIFFHPRESFIVYGNGGEHEHFNHNERSFEELILNLLEGLIGRMRIIEYSWDGQPKRFHFQTINDNGTWDTLHKLNFPKWKFWLKNKEIQKRILINDYNLKQDISNTLLAKKPKSI